MNDCLHENLGGPNTQLFSGDLWITKIFEKVFDISKKCPNNGLVSEKKYIIFSVTLEGGGSDRIVTFVTIFFFF